MSDIVQQWHDAVASAWERVYGPMSEERKYTVELTDEQAVVLHMVIAWATLAATLDGIEPLSLSRRSVHDLYEISQALTLQVLAKED